MDILAAVQHYIERNQLLPPGSQVLLGVSGGPDSVALLNILLRLSEPLRLTLHVGHLHHGIRGVDADNDATFVTDLASEWYLPCTVERVDVPAFAQREGVALEEAARRARYSFLVKLAQQVGASVIAVGHNADDQAETVLMHLLRGSGTAGLRGMLPVTPMRRYQRLLGDVRVPPELNLIRPLLDVSREDIEAYCAAQNLSPRLDYSNLDVTFFRNRLRHEVLPYLAELNPRIAQRLQNLAKVVRADYALLQEFVSVAWDELLVMAYDDKLVFDLQGWRRQSLSVQRAMMRRAFYKLRRSVRNLSFEHVDEAVRVAQQGSTGIQVTLPQNVVLTVGYTSLSVADRAALHLPPERPWLTPASCIPLSIPGTTSLPGGWSVRAELLQSWDMDTIRNNPSPFCAWVDADVLGDAPCLRTRRQGDRMQPKGLGGSTARLSDLLINVKFPHLWRDYLPLLVGRGQLLWAVGVRLSESVLVCPETKRVARLRFLGP